MILSIRAAFDPPAQHDGRASINLWKKGLFNARPLNEECTEATFVHKLDEGSGTRLEMTALILLDRGGYMSELQSSSARRGRWPRYRHLAEI